MKIIYTEPTPDNRDRVYARMETTEGSNQLLDIRFGTVTKEKVTQEPVRKGEYEKKSVNLDAIEDYYAAEITEDFVERPLDGFVQELTDRTPYAREEAEIIVTKGWFDLSTTEALRAINQHLREPYDELPKETFREKKDAVAKTREQIENAREYPYGL